MSLLRRRGAEANPGPLTIAQTNAKNPSKAKQPAPPAAEADPYPLQEAKLSPSPANTWKAPGHTTLSAPTKTGGTARQHSHARKVCNPERPNESCGMETRPSRGLSPGWSTAASCRGLGAFCMTPKAPATASPHLFASTLRGFPSLLCGNFIPPPPSRRHPAEHPATADQPAALFGDTGFMLENAPGMTVYSQSGAEGALGLAWLRGVGAVSCHFNRTADSKHKFPTSAITLVRGAPLTHQPPHSRGSFTAGKGQIGAISVKHQKLRDPWEEPPWKSTKHRPAPPRNAPPSAVAHTGVKLVGLCDGPPGRTPPTSKP
ncbi:hypothetical protein Q4I32_000927 [Leishmania shawi]|uniref:Uncharacterized protein n=1 Tax=Leishmania shawi TaxID=5680 RepID=A0AAW3C953_9TRYP